MKDIPKGLFKILFQRFTTLQPFSAFGGMLTMMYN